jgi:hypothetical protein
MQMDLQTDLAVLSACETARGRFGAHQSHGNFTQHIFDFLRIAISIAALRKECSNSLMGCFTAS